MRELEIAGSHFHYRFSSTQPGQRLQARRQALKVELAAQGTYVGFADEAASRGRAPARAPAEGGQAGSEQGGTR